MAQGRKTVPRARSPKVAGKGKARAEGGGLEELRRWFDEKGLTKAKVGGVDIDGVWRGKYISKEKFFSAAKGGLGFCDVVFGWDLADELYDNAKVTGWHTGYPDAQARVDVSTGRIIPWEPDSAAFLLDFVNPDGTPFEASPRQLLQRVGRHARELGFCRASAPSTSTPLQETAQSLREKSFANLTRYGGEVPLLWVRTRPIGLGTHLDGCTPSGAN